MVRYRVTFMVRTSEQGSPTVIRDADFPDHDKALDAALAWQNLVQTGTHVFEVALIDLPDA